MRRILVATDGSDGASRAVDAAAELASKLHLELWIVSAMEGVSEPVQEFVEREGVAIGDALNVETNQILAQAKDRCQSAGAQTIQLKSVWGDAAAGILELAREIAAQ